MPELIAGLDLGTTNFKVGLYDRAGTCRGLGRRAFEKDRPEASRCEVPVQRFRQTLRDALDDAVAAAGCERAAIRGVSYASQANSFLLLGADGEPLTPIIVWQDARATPLPARLQEFWTQPALIEATGLGLFGPEAMVAKLDWFRRERPNMWARCYSIVTLSDYLSWLLTGRRIGDSGTASLLGLWDLRKGCWYRPALELLSLDEGQLPALHRPGSLTVPISRTGAEWLGLSDDIPFTVGALDHHTAALGAGIGSLAPVSVSFGTSLVCFRFLRDYVPRAGCCMGPSTGQAGFYQISFSSPGTSVLDEYRKPPLTYEELLSMAEGIAPGANGLRAEIADGALCFSGRNGKHGQGHHVRAILELTGRTVARLLDDLGMDQAFRAKPVILGVGGGARSALWMRAVAEVSGAEVIRACPADTAAKGAAMLSSVAIGWFDDLGRCGELWCGNRGS